MQRKEYGTLSKLIPLTFYLGSFCLMGINVFLDPFHYYLFPDPRAKAFSSEERYQSPSLIKHLSFDTVVIGSSLSTNFKAEMFPKEVGFLNLSARGAPPKLERELLALVLKHPGLKTVYLELYSTTFKYGPDYDAGDFPDYLYHPGFATPFKHLLTFDFAKRRLQGSIQKRLDGLYSWYDAKQDHFGETTYLKDYTFQCDRKWMEKTKAERFEKDYVFDPFVSMIRSHPEIHFEGYLPPALSVVDYYRLPQLLDFELGYRESLKKKFSGLSNFKLHDFATLDYLVNDVGRYIDFGHFDLEGSKDIARLLVTGQHLVDVRTWDSSGSLLNTVRRFDLATIPQCNHLGDNIGMRE